MPRRSILSAAELDGLIVVPKAKDELIRHYTFNEADLAIIRQRRGPANRLGFAILLCYMRMHTVGRRILYVTAQRPRRSSGDRGRPSTSAMRLIHLRRRGYRFLAFDSI